MAADLEEALGVLHKAAGLLAEPRRAASVEVSRTVAEGGKDWHAEVPSGWEANVAELAEVAARRARGAVDLLREHVRAAVEHRQAVPVAGIRRAPAARSRDDETPAVNVDRDAVFNAIEDLLLAVDPSTAAGNRLPADLDAAIAGAVDDLGAAWAEASGDGSLDRLAAAARRLIEAARPHEARWPATFATTVRITELALAPLHP